MLCLFNNSGARCLRVLLPVLFCLACLAGVRPAQAATATIGDVTAQYNIMPPPMSSRVTDFVSWNYSTTWDAVANPAIYCNFTTVLVAQYLDASGQPLDIGQGHFERTYPVPELTGTDTAPTSSSHKSALLDRGQGKIGAGPSGTKSTRYFYRAILTVSDGSQTYASATKESNANTF